MARSSSGSSSSNSDCEELEKVSFASTFSVTTIVLPDLGSQKGDESVQEFHRRFKGKLKKFKNWSDLDKTRAFVNGLRPELKNFVKEKRQQQPQDLTSLDDVVTIARCYEAGLAQRFFDGDNQSTKQSHRKRNSTLLLVSFCILAILAGFSLFGVIIYFFREKAHIQRELLCKH